MHSRISHKNSKKSLHSFILAYVIPKIREKDLTGWICFISNARCWSERRKVSTKEFSVCASSPSFPSSNLFQFLFCYERFLLFYLVKAYQWILFYFIHSLVRLRCVAVVMVLVSPTNHQRQRTCWENCNKTFTDILYVPRWWAH